MKLLFCLILAFMLPAVLPAQKKLKTAEEYYTRGSQFLESKPERAMADFNAALKLDSLYCGAYSTIAAIHQQKKDFKTALQFHTKAIECMRNKGDNQGIIMFTWNRGLCKHEARDYEAALEDYKAIIKIDSNASTGYILASHEYLFLKQYEPAIKTARMLVNLPNTSSDDKMYVERCVAHSLLLQGKISEALTIHQANQNYQYSFAGWKQYVQEEFADFRKAGLPSQNFASIEKALGLPISK